MPVLNGSPKKLILNGKQYLGIMPSASLTTKTITANGTYNASSDNADGYSSVTVNVPTEVLHWSNDNKICVKEVLGRTIWYFVGLTKGSSDIAVPSELRAYLPSFPIANSYVRTYGFPTPSSSSSNSYTIGFVNPFTSNIMIRSWLGDYLHEGTFYGVLDLMGGQDQTNPYEEP